MKIKEADFMISPLSQFDLLGEKETSRAKAFAFILGKESVALYKFLRYIGVKVKKTQKNFLSTSIVVEEVTEDGRLDIEIKQNNKLHVIIECKIKKNKVGNQRLQYLDSFNNDGNMQKVMCFITDINDYKVEKTQEIKMVNISWIEILSLLNTKEFKENLLITEFISYLRGNLSMIDQKEILVQDLGNEKEIERFLDNYVYRRDITFGRPLYFAPHFTNSAAKLDRVKSTGICYISSILGILTLAACDIDSFEDSLKQFSANSENPTELLKYWKEGIIKDSNSPEEEKEFTYFFLDKPLKINKPLQKCSSGTDSTGWIANMIPPNRCVSFFEFLKRIQQN